MKIIQYNLIHNLRSWSTKKFKNKIHQNLLTLFALYSYSGVQSLQNLKWVPSELYLSMLLAMSSCQ